VERIQDRHQESQALTYYDDLGLPASASGEEIREAYLGLVQLLHPDLHRAPALKQFTNNQMKRVSRAYAVLSDAERRQSYDEELARRGAPRPEPPATIKRTAGRSRARALITIGWLICAFAGIVGIGWYVSQQTSASSDPAQVNAAPIAPAGTQVAAAGPPAQPTNPATGGVTDKAAELDAVRAELASAKTDRDRALEQIVLQAKELDFLTGEILAAPSRPSANAGRFSGVWVLPKPKTAPVSSAFTPESVDLIVSEQDGSIQGRYRARYPSMGATEPPMVRFYFEGKSENDVANAVLTGEHGSRGEIQLKLASGNALQLVWSVTEAGNQNDQASGTVALIRKREP
jgi:hypothetical protein